MIRSDWKPLAAEIGDRASVGTPREATEFGEVVVFSVLWDSINDALAEMGSLEGKTVINTSKPVPNPPYPLHVARYCVGDVGGERRDRPQGIRRLQRLPSG